MVHGIRMSRCSGFIVAACLALSGLSACGGGGGGGGRTFLIDFESLTVSSTPLPNPSSIGAGVTVTGSADFYIQAAISGWALGSCNAVPTSGSQFFGNSQTMDTFYVVFDEPVASVSLNIAGVEGTQITVDALDEFVQPLETVSYVQGNCPISMQQIDFGAGATSNQIHGLRIFGSAIVLDDLQYTRR